MCDEMGLAILHDVISYNITITTEPDRAHLINPNHCNWSFK